MYTVTGKKTENTVVEIGLHEVSKILETGDIPISTIIEGMKSSFRFSVNIRNDCFLAESGYWEYEYEDFGGSSSWFSNAKERRATKQEIVCWDLIIQLEESIVLMKLKDER